MGRGRVKTSRLDKTVLQNSPPESAASVGKVPVPPDGSRILDKLTAAFIFIFSVFIYLSTVYPSLPGGDSGELMVTAKEFGVAHPPGYPLFTVLAKLMIEALPYGSTAFRVNVLACLLGSVTNCAIVVLLIKSTQNVAVAMIMVAMLGFSRLFWIWSITGEVFALNNFFCSLILLSAHTFLKEEDKEKKLKLAYVLALLSGLTLTNQHTSVLLIIPLVAFVVSDLLDAELITPRNVAGLSVTGFSGLLPYLQLPLASYLRTARVSWGDHRTFDGFFFHFFRKSYGTLKLIKSDAEVSIMTNVNVLAVDLCRELTIPLVLLSVLGLLTILWRPTNQKYICFLGSTFAVYAAFFCTFANIAEITGIYKGVLERFWMQPALSLVLLAGQGLTELLRVAKVNKSAILPVAFLILAARVHSNYEMCDQSNNYHVEKFGRHVLSHLPNNTILLTSGDLSTNTFRYLTIAEGVRPDVQVLDMSFIGSPWFIPILGHHFPGVVFPGVAYISHARHNTRLYNLEQFLDHNLKHRPVFVCLKPRDDTPPLAKYDILPYSFCSQFLPKGAVDPLLYGKQIPAPDLSTYLPPRTELFGDQAWEDVVLHEYWEALAKPGRYLWSSGEESRRVERKKQFYLAAYEYLFQAKEEISQRINSGELSPVTWNHTSYYSKYLGVQCRQLWVHTTGRSRDPGSLGEKYEACQRKYFTDYIESAPPLTKTMDKDFKNIQMLLENPGM